MKGQPFKRLNMCLAILGAINTAKAGSIPPEPIQYFSRGKGGKRAHSISKNHMAKVRAAKTKRNIAKRK